jgi:hypothetical protein
VAAAIIAGSGFLAVTAAVCGLLLGLAAIAQLTA